MLKLLATETRAIYPGTTQDSEHQSHGVSKTLPSGPKMSPPSAITTEALRTDEESGVFQNSTQMDKDNTAREERSLKRISLRGSAPSFHAHATLPSDTMTSTKASSAEGFHVTTNSMSFHPEPTPLTEGTPSPSRSYQGRIDQQSLAISSPPPISSHNPSSPSHSVYEGYVYGPSSYEFPPERQVDRQPSVASQHGAESHLPSNQPDTLRSPYYSQPPAFPILGSQPPLTPSATPFSNMPQQSNYIHGYISPGSLCYYSTQVPGFQPQVGQSSPATLQAEGSTFPNGQQAGDGFAARQADMYRSQAWSTTILNSPQYPPTTIPFSQALLVAHLLRNFNLPEYADCRLFLRHKDERFGTIQWYLSTLLLAQSTKLRAMIQASETGTDGRRIIQIILTDRFVNPKSMEAVLRVCYGESPQAFTGTTSQDQLSKTRTEVLKPWMEETLSFAAAGCLLQMDDVVLRGLDIASKILSWENLESALSFSLESEIERGRNTSASVIPSYRPPHPIGGERSSSCEFNGHQPEMTPTTDDSNALTTSTSASGDYHPPQPHTAFDLLMHCLRFLTDNFPIAWQLDVSARPLAEVDRLPATAESRSPLSKSRLCNIQFGDRPSEATATLGDRNMLVSTVLLSLPHIWLDYLLKAVGEPIRREISSIVKERERRRHIVLRSQSVSREQRDAAKDYEWAEAAYEESVQTSADGQVILSRSYVGIASDISIKDMPKKLSVQ